MDRRKFLSLGVLAGLTAGVTAGERKLVMAQPMPQSDATPYTGTFFLMIHASGGWDPTMVCDPKGNNGDPMTAVNRYFTPAQIGQAGNIRYAPTMYNVDGGAYSNRQFFEKFHDRLLVLNSIDMQTNNHDGGTRYTWSGHLEDGYPPLAALIAAAKAPGRPLAFLSNGGYDNTQGVVPLARVDNLDTIYAIAYPNVVQRGRGDLFQTNATAERVRRYQQQRLAAQVAQQTLPTYESSMRQLLATRGSGNLLQGLIDHLPTNADIGRSNNPIYRQGIVALAAYQAGVSAAANLTTGGFDTHGDHDRAQGDALGRLLHGVDLLMDRIEEMGLSDRVVVMIGSDFGRTPQYNSGNGKDHWSVTSAMMMGPGIRGDRVIGETTDSFRARGLDFGTLQVSDSSSQHLNPKSIHMAMRRFAGIERTELARQYPIAGDDISLFA